MHTLSDPAGRKFWLPAGLSSLLLKQAISLGLQSPEMQEGPRPDLSGQGNSQQAARATWLRSAGVSSLEMESRSLASDMCRPEVNGVHISKSCRQARIPSKLSRLPPMLRPDNVPQFRGATDFFSTHARNFQAKLSTTLKVRPICPLQEAQIRECAHNV